MNHQLKTRKKLKKHVFLIKNKILGILKLYTDQKPLDL